MKIGLCQFAPVWENPLASIEKIENLLLTHAKVDLLIFPELSLTGFTMESKKFAEDISGISMQYFMNLSERLRTNIFCGLIEEDEDGIFNSLFHFDNKGLIKALYRKIHPFSYGKEDEFYTASKELVITEINHINFGLSICYDLRFPELYRLYTKQGIDVLINIANWPLPRIEHWKTLLKARAIENQCFMIGVNRVGVDPFHNYPGCSAIFDPLGKEMIMAENEEGIFISEINLDEVAQTRNNLPFLNDMKLI
jgi:omega-amidase